MFDDIGDKIKTVTSVICFLNMVALFIMGFVILIGSSSSYHRSAGQMGIGLLVMFGGPLLVWAGSLVTYGLGELIEVTQENNRYLEAISKGINSGFEKEIHEADEKEKAEEEKNRKEREAQEHIRQEAERKAKEEERVRREAEEKAKQDRYQTYWEEHAEEKVALEAKRTEASEKLKKLGLFASKEKQQLEQLIKDIDTELEKDR